jgi:hypothetical protein
VRVPAQNPPHCDALSEPSTVRRQCMQPPPGEPLQSTAAQAHSSSAVDASETVSAAALTSPPLTQLDKPSVEAMWR